MTDRVWRHRAPGLVSASVRTRALECHKPGFQAHGLPFNFTWILLGCVCVFDSAINLSFYCYFGFLLFIVMPYFLLVPFC